MIATIEQLVFDSESTLLEKVYQFSRSSCSVLSAIRV